MWPDSSDGCGAVWLITTEFVIRRTVCVYYYKTVLLLTTSCRLKELRLLSVVILFDSETFLLSLRVKLHRAPSPAQFDLRPLTPPTEHAHTLHLLLCVCVGDMAAVPPLRPSCQYAKTCCISALVLSTQADEAGGEVVKYWCQKLKTHNCSPLRKLWTHLGL